MKLSLRNRFLIPTLVLIISGLFVSITISYVKSKDAIVDAITQQLVLLTDSTERTLVAWINDRKLDIKSWSGNNDFQKAFEDSFVGMAARMASNRQLAGLKQDYGYYEDINLADASGLISASSNLDIVKNLNIKDRGYFQEALKGNLFLSDVLESKVTKNPVVIISAPIKKRDEITGVIFGVIDLHFYSESFIKPIKIGEGGYSYVANRDGLVIAHPDQDSILNLSLKEYEFGKEILQKSRGVIHYQHEGVDKIAAYKRNQGLGWIFVMTANTGEILSPVTSIRTANLGVALAMVAVIVLAIYLVVRSVVLAVDKIAEGLNECNTRVVTASQQISLASKSLADGSSEQAASIEETSSSLEEMDSMTQQNAAHADEANQKTREAKQIVEKVTLHLTDMIEAVGEISRSTNETEKIIKTIDEIAFQTNLLALNAAVEAARAGQAGAGFAVVASEVRNLALRSANAAKDTAELIRNTIGAVQKGTDLTRQTQAVLEENSSVSEKIGQLVDEIASASNEQAQGISQVNKAVADMERITQNNAASAEETSSSAEEMHDQTEQMAAFIRDLLALVRGRGARIEEFESMAFEPTGNRMARSLSEHPKSLPDTGTGKSFPAKLLLR